MPSIEPYSRENIDVAHDRLVDPALVIAIDLAMERAEAILRRTMLAQLGGNAYIAVRLRNIEPQEASVAFLTRSERRAPLDASCAGAIGRLH